MPELTRRAVLATIGVLTTTGCIAGPPAGNATDAPPADTSSQTTGTPTGNGITHGADEPNADHAVYLSNQGASERTIRVQVVREVTGDTVFDETLAIAPNSEREVYNLQQASPADIEEFTICGHLADQPPTPSGTATPDPTDTGSTPDSAYRDCITMRTDSCYGTAHVTVQDTGELRVIYAIC